MNLNLMTFFQETIYGAYVSIYGEDGAYVIHLDDKTKKVFHCVSLNIDRNASAYFNSFRIECIRGINQSQR